MRYIESMSDEPKEQPQEQVFKPDPHKSIWDTFANRTEMHDISVNNKFQSSQESEMNVDEMRKNLINKFLGVIPDGSVSQSFMTPEDKEEDNISYDVLVETDMDRQGVLVKREEYIPEELADLRKNRQVFEYNGQVYPFEFRGPDGKVYKFIGEYYHLNPNGDDIVKVEYLTSDRDINNLPTLLEVPEGLQKENGPHEYVKKGLSVRDLEFLGTVLHQIKSGEVIPYPEVNK